MIACSEFRVYSSLHTANCKGVVCRVATHVRAASAQSVLDPRELLHLAVHESVLTLYLRGFKRLKRHVAVHIA